MAVGARNGASGPGARPDGLRAARSLPPLAALLAASAAFPVRGESVYHEADGLVVVEIESVPAAKGWVEGTELAGYTGRC